MTPDILLVLGILAVVFVVLVTEVMPLEVLALLVLGALALTGLVSPAEALAGFSNPAVVTIWAVFILSGGLTRTGIANILGRYLLKMAGSGDKRMVVLIMVIAGGLSAFMNNVAVAAMMLPVVMDITRKTGRSPSQMLMPLAYGSLLGGLTTMIGTPPNILVSEALRTNGMTPFGLFDFTPVGLIVMLGGVLFVTLVGGRLLPRQNSLVDKQSQGNQITSQYRIHERLFRITVPKNSSLVGRTLAASNLGSRLGLNVVGINRHRQTLLAPQTSEILQADDELIVEGRLDRIEEMNNWGHLLAEDMDSKKWDVLGDTLQVAEVHVAAACPYIERSLADVGFRNRYALNVLAIRRADEILNRNLKSQPLRADDVLVLLGPAEKINELANEPGFLPPVFLDWQVVEKIDVIGNGVRLFRIPDSSRLLGKTVTESCLGDALDVQVLSIIRNNGTAVIPASNVHFAPGDRLVVSGMSNMAEVLLLRGLEGVFVREQEGKEDGSILEDDKVGMIEVMLSPQSVLSGMTLQDISFRDKYGLNVLAVWRKGQVIRTGLRDLRLQFGDALLLFGSWKKLTVLGREPDFLVLTKDMQEVVRDEKATTAMAIMAAVLLPVMFGWVPIYIAVVIGAAFMVLTKCLTMDEAYRYIEWKAVFLIAGMLPLGVALDTSGTATLVAESMISLLGPFGPYGVLFGLLVITFIATSIIPTAALVVLMVPIALKTSVGLGISPYPLMMGIAMAASSSFTSPISHPANVLVMGPGGYKFIDYMKLGVPLTLVILAVLMVIIPIFWPLTG
jgi:di/tricarboxylate transporter